MPVRFRYRYYTKSHTFLKKVPKICVTLLSNYPITDCIKAKIRYLDQRVKHIFRNFLINQTSI